MTILELQPLLNPIAATLSNDELCKIIRATRNTMLAECDWTQLPDSPLSESERITWADYRQQLRDVFSQNVDSVLSINFPDSPQ